MKFRPVLIGLACACAPPLGCGLLGGPIACASDDNCPTSRICRDGACVLGFEDDLPPDAGPSGDEDAGAADGGNTNAGAADAGATDAGAADAGATDASATDGGNTDAGAADAGAAGSDGGR